MGDECPGLRTFDGGFEVFGEPAASTQTNANVRSTTHRLGLERIRRNRPADIVVCDHATHPRCQPVVAAQRSGD